MLRLDANRDTQTTLDWARVHALFDSCGAKGLRRLSGQPPSDCRALSPERLCCLWSVHMRLSSDIWRTSFHESPSNGEFYFQA